MLKLDKYNYAVLFSPLLIIIMYSPPFTSLRLKQDLLPQPGADPELYST